MAALMIPDPYGLMEPQLGRPIPIQIGRARELFDFQSVKKVLPGAINEVRYRRGVVDINRYIQLSELVLSREVTPQDMQEAWFSVLSSLGRHEGNARTTLNLIDRLEECYRLDRQQPTVARSNYPRTLTLFLCLSEISQQMRSKCIGTIMSNFFSKHGQNISRTDPRCVLQWGEAIIAAEMSDGEVMTCVREMIAGRPDLPLEARNQFVLTPSTEYFLLLVEDLMARMNEGEFDWPDRGRGRWRRGGRGFGLNFRRADHRRFPPRRFRNDFHDFPRRFGGPAYDTRLYDDDYLFDEPRGFGGNYALGGGIRGAIEDLREDVQEVKAEVREIGMEVALDRHVPRGLRGNVPYFGGGLDDYDLNDNLLFRPPPRAIPF